MKITRRDQFENLPHILDRLNPFVITEANDSGNSKLLKQAISSIEPYKLLEKIESPKQLFEFIQENKSQLIIITDDIFAKRKNYIDIVQGAICSSPDSMALWSVSYRNEKSFVFKGKLILCTSKTKEEIKANKKFKMFVRDCHII